jgi:hypothetical protein
VAITSICYTGQASCEGFAQVARFCDNGSNPQDLLDKNKLIIGGNGPILMGQVRGMPLFVVLGICFSQ